MVINKANLSILYTALLTAFNVGFSGLKPQWNVVATEVPSTTAENQYGWLGQFPMMREWLGDRVINNLKLHDYTIRNKTWENTIGVPRDAIDDDQYGVYLPVAQEQGRMVAEHPDVLTYALLSSGFSTTCYDGQYFFDTDHPVTDANGNETSISNFQGGAGTAWYLIDDSRAIKPIILQMRRKPKFVAKTQEADDNVFNRNEFLYGVDGRWNVGFALWQLAYASKQTLDTANLALAIAAMGSQAGDNGRKLGTKGRVLVVPPSLEFVAKGLIAATLPAGGENPMANAVRVEVCPWL